jgi:hypothetical protein
MPTITLMLAALAAVAAANPDYTPAEVTFPVTLRATVVGEPAQPAKTPELPELPGPSEAPSGLPARRHEPVNAPVAQPGDHPTAGWLLVDSDGDGRSDVALRCWYVEAFGAGRQVWAGCEPDEPGTPPE